MFEKQTGMGDASRTLQDNIVGPVVNSPPVLLSIVFTSILGYEMKRSILAVSVHVGECNSKHIEVMFE